MIFVLVSITGCSVFEYSPYDDNLNTSIRNSNLKNISRIQDILTETETDSFDFAIISDSHSDYDDLHEVVKKINSNSDIKLTIHLGDQTDLGLKFEFENSLNELNNLKFPYVVVIGNHDYLSQGKSIFEMIYGKTNFSFQIGTNNFIGFDNIVWENNNSRPNFEWLKNELAGLEGNKFLLMHLTETSNSMELYREEYLSIINNIQDLYRFHGHTHVLDIDWPRVVAPMTSDRIIPVISVRGNIVSYYFLEPK